MEILLQKEDHFDDDTQAKSSLKHRKPDNPVWINGITNKLKICRLDEEYNSTSLVNDVNLFAKFIQTTIALCVCLLIAMNFYFINHCTKSMQEKQFILVRLLRNKISLPGWFWLFLLASLTIVNIKTLLICLYDMRQFKRNSCRVSKKLLLFLLWSGGWLVAPLVLLLTEYNKILNYTIRDCIWLLMKIITLSLATLFGLIYLNMRFFSK